MRHIIVDGVVFDTAGDLAVKVRKLLENHSKADRVGKVHVIQGLEDSGEFIGFRSDAEDHRDRVQGLIEEVTNLEEQLSHAEANDDELRAECTRLYGIIGANIEIYNANIDSMKSAYDMLLDKVNELAEAQADELRAELTAMSDTVDTQDEKLQLVQSILDDDFSDGPCECCDGCDEDDEDPFDNEECLECEVRDACIHLNRDLGVVRWLRACIS